MKQLLISAFENDAYITLWERPTNSHLPDYLIQGKGWDFVNDELEVSPDLEVMSDLSSDREYAITTYVNILGQLTGKIIT